MKWLDNYITRIINEKILNDNYDVLHKLNDNINILNINISKIINNHSDTIIKLNESINILNTNISKITDNHYDIYKKENLELKKKLARMEDKNVQS